jgi:uncharacterized protein
VTTEVPEWSAEVVAELPYPVIFATVSGAHLYGFASVDSDLDLRAAHLLPATEVVGLRLGPETLQNSGWRDGTPTTTWASPPRKRSCSTRPER